MVKTERRPTPKKIVRILIVDDHPLVRRGIRDLIRSDPDFDLYARRGQ